MLLVGVADSDPRLLLAGILEQSGFGKETGNLSEWIPAYGMVMLKSKGIETCSLPSPQNSSPVS